MPSYSERTAWENSVVRCRVREAYTGDNPTLAQIKALAEGLPKYARVSIHGTLLRVSWVEPHAKAQ